MIPKNTRIQPYGFNNKNCFFELTKTVFISLGIDSFIVKVSKKSDTKKMKQQKSKRDFRLKELSRLGKLKKTDETQKENQKKLRKSESINYVVQQSNNIKVQNASKMHQKISLIENKKKTLIQLLLDYFQQNRKKALALFVSYLVFIGLIFGTPLIVKHLKVKSQVQTEQE